MRVTQLRTNILKVAVALLLLAFALPGTQAQQIYPRPTVPPTPATLPPAQTVPPGFESLGFIQYASVDQLCDPAPATTLDTTPGAVVTPVTPPPPPTPAGCKTSGGWIQINNDIIRIPANTVVILPNTYMTWEEIFENNPGAIVCTGPSTCTLQPPVPGESGLALSDTVRPIYTHEADVQGQIVNGNYIAGIIRISQQSVNGMQGFIEKVNYADGSVQVNGTRIQINDPVIQLQDMAGNYYNKGRYTIGQTPDARFTSDQGNTTVRTITGYPMCIPRTSPGTYPSGPGTAGTPDPYVPGTTGLDDPQCPEINRPRDAGGILLPFYTMNVPGDAPTVDNPNPQDPYTEAPFEVGDFVSIIGTQFQDANGTPYVSATEIVANLGIYTFPNVDPAYVLVEVLLMGTGGAPDPAFPQEAARRTRVEGFSTDPQRNVDVSAVDIDSCGNLTFRLPTWVSNFPVEQGLPLIGKKGRWRFRPNGGTFLPPVQNVGAQISGGAQAPNNNGIIYGYYQLPMGEFIFPEDLVPGNLPPSYNFKDLPFLTSGTGPWPTPGSIYDSQLIQLGFKRPETPQPQATQSIGQLSPFPDTVAPPPQVCVPGDPSAAHAVATYTAAANPIIAGTLVTLNSVGSFPSGGPFQWAQVVNAGDPVVTINNPQSATATFIAPNVASALSLNFTLTVGVAGGPNTPSTASLSIPITLAPAGTPPGVTATASPNPPTGDGVTVVTLTANGVDPAVPGCSPNCGLTFTWAGADAATIAAISGGQITLVSGAADGSVQTFIAPFIPAGATPLVYTFNVTATSSVGAHLSSTAPITVQVNPSVDLITIAHVRYLKKIARLVINASDFTPNVTLTVTLAGPNGESPTINGATGEPYTGVMGPVIPFAPGVFTIRFTNVPPPDLVTIRSTAGGIAVSGVTLTR